MKTCFTHNNYWFKFAGEFKFSKASLPHNLCNQFNFLHMQNRCRSHKRKVRTGNSFQFQTRQGKKTPTDKWMTLLSSHIRFGKIHPTNKSSFFLSLLSHQTDQYGAAQFVSMKISRLFRGFFSLLISTIRLNVENATRMCTPSVVGILVIACVFVHLRSSMCASDRTVNGGEHGRIRWCVCALFDIFTNCNKII